ncbi:MAG: hypothetical protein U9N81_07330 [Bacillota bacterium]|nr:hypothetical protein [Bacillota bacterium]
MTHELITLIFHNEGLRSYIEVDLCARCPRQDEKGCCALYSPVFYPTDLAFLLLQKPEMVDYIFQLNHLTILDTSVTANHSIDGNSFLCAFHTRETGCVLPQELRESICRHFVCSGISWWEEESLKPWKDFFDQLADYEIELNDRIGEKLLEKGLNLRQKELRPAFFEALVPLYQEEIATPPSFFNSVPPIERIQLVRPLKYGLEWEL